MPTTLTSQTDSTNNPLSAMQNGEKNLGEIKRHPIGIYKIYISETILVIILAVVCFAILPMSMSSNHRQAYLIGALIFVLVGTLSAVFVGIARTVYWSNRWIITSDSLTQILRNSLFNQQSSQLSLENLEDVTVEKNGIVSSMFNFGLLRVETAGDKSKFVFKYCPDPESKARMILNAREAFNNRDDNKSNTKKSPSRDENIFAGGIALENDFEIDTSVER